MLLGLALMAGAAQAQERDWTLDASEEDAYLIFGVPDSDDVGVSLWCRIGRGAVYLYMPVSAALITPDKDKTAPVTIIAGQQTATFRGKAEIDAKGSFSSIEAELDAGHPIITALRTVDRFTVKTGTAEVVFPLYNSGVSDLFELCRKP